MSIDAQLTIITGPENFQQRDRPSQKMFNTKSAILLMAFVGAFVVVSCDRYSDKYDYVDVDAILSNPRQRNQYYKCFADEGPCLTPDAKFFKDNLRESIVTNCKKCTEKQKIAYDKISVFYTETEPEKYNAIVAKAIEAARKH